MIYSIIQIKILKKIKEKPNLTKTSISYDLKVTYPHTFRLINDLQRNGYLTQKKISQRNVEMKLTSKAEELLNDKIVNIEKHFI